MDGTECELELAEDACYYVTSSCSFGVCKGFGSICDEVACGDVEVICGDVGCVVIRIGCGHIYYGSFCSGLVSEEMDAYGVVCGILGYFYAEFSYLLEVVGEDEITVTLVEGADVYVLFLLGVDCVVSECSFCVQFGEFKVVSGGDWVVVVEGFSEVADEYTFFVSCTKSSDFVFYCFMGYCGDDGIGGECVMCGVFGSLDKCESVGSLMIDEG